MFAYKLFHWVPFLILNVAIDLLDRADAHFAAQKAGKQAYQQAKKILVKFNPRLRLKSSFIAIESAYFNSWIFISPPGDLGSDMGCHGFLLRLFAAFRC